MSGRTTRVSLRLPAPLLARARDEAARAGLADQLQRLENPAPPTASVREAATVRGRALQSFVVPFEGIEWAGVPGDVVDLPGNLVTVLERGGLVARVDPGTPLHQVQVRW